MNKTNLIKYSKIYWKTLTDQNFTTALSNLESNHLRLKFYLPLYAAINDNYGLIKDGETLERVAKYLQMMNNGLEADHFYKKFITSMKSHFHLKPKKVKFVKEISNTIKTMITNNKIKTEDLINKYKLNGKIIYQIKHDLKPSISFIKLSDACEAMEKDYIK